MPDTIRLLEREGERLTPYQQFVRGLEIHLETFGVNMRALTRETGLEKQSDLLEVQGQRFFGGMCQLVDDLGAKTATLGEHETIKINELVERLSGKKIEPQTHDAMLNAEKLLDPMIKEIQSSSRTDGEEYDSKKITTPKIIMALTALAVDRQKTVSLLPQGINPEENQKLKKVLERHKKHLKSKDRPLKKDLGAKWVQVAMIAGLIVGALGFGASGYVKFADRNLGVAIETKWQNFWSEASGGRIKTAMEAGRNGRYEQYLNNDEKKPTVAKVLRSGQWPDYNSQDIIGLLDPYSNEYSQWLAFVEWCGPQCFLDPNWIPSGRGQTEIMDLLGLTEAEYRDYQQHPEKWPNLVDHLRDIYPDKPWLAELFSVRPTRSDLEGKSDFELWREKYQIQGNVDNGIRLSMLGKPVIRNLGFDNRFNKGQQQWRTGRSGGRGFGTPKGV